MFAELVELGKRVYKGHAALGIERCSWEIVIDNEGCFMDLRACNVTIEAERLLVKKGNARLLLDKPEETLGYKEDKSKHEKYLEKLNGFKDIVELRPVFSFFSSPHEVELALGAFNSLPPTQQKGNMTFVVDDVRLVDLDCVKNAIKIHYEQELHALCQEDSFCSVCGKNHYPILDKPHGAIKKMPNPQPAGNMLISYNEKAFESYNLEGNLNSGICTNCARNYVEAVNFLLSNGSEIRNEKGQKQFKYSNRQGISDDTVALFWTKEQCDDIDPFSDIYGPTEERVRRLFRAIVIGESERVNTQLENYFYCCTLSTAAARIAVRDWMAISISQYQRNIKQWFEDIETIKDNETYYPGINSILNSCIKKKSKPTKSDYKAKARIGIMLWHAALTNSPLPVLILQNILDQIEHLDKNKKYKNFTEEQSTVIRLVLNRNNKNKCKMKNVLDNENENKAYLCGRLFALVCKLQYKSQGTVNSSIYDRFFASASNTPARVFGLLLTKYVPIYEKKTKGAYSKSITEIAARIETFPEQFTTTQRGEFALGYYYQYNTKQNGNTIE